MQLMSLVRKDLHDAVGFWHS